MMRPIYVDLPTVASIVALSITSVQKLVREEQFPKPRAVSSRRVAWLVREIEEWAEARPISDLPPPPNTSRRKPQ
ncbi:Prophage CP4-57 regulatory protein (AlpA) [compost metagenome]